MCAVCPADLSAHCTSTCSAFSPIILFQELSFIPMSFPLFSILQTCAPPPRAPLPTDHRHGTPLGEPAGCSPRGACQCLSQLSLPHCTLCLPIGMLMRPTGGIKALLRAAWYLGDLGAFVSPKSGEIRGPGTERWHLLGVQSCLVTLTGKHSCR